MGGGPSILRRGPAEKSNAELVAALKGNFSTYQQASSQPSSHHNEQQTNGDSTPSYKSWTRQEGSQLFIPSVNFKTGLLEERDQYDITLKLFYLPGIPPSRRCEHTREAIDLVLRELNVPSVDLLIASFPGISFDADDEDLSDEDEGDKAPLENGTNHINTSDDCNDGDVPAEDISTMATTWATLESLHSSGVIRNLGVAEFGSTRLSRFLSKIHTRPSVDQINVRDCCVVPRQLILFAKEQKIELLTHNDCTNILPRGTIRELLGKGASGAGVLAASDSSDGKANSQEPGLRGDVEPQWVVKYTAVVKNRGVIENKGYFAGAELNEQA